VNIGCWSRGVGKPGFPTPPPRRGGETRFPHSPTRGRVWEGAALPGSIFIPSVCGAAAWTVDVNIAHERGSGETWFPQTLARGRVWRRTGNGFPERCRQ